MTLLERNPTPKSIVLKVDLCTLALILSVFASQCHSNQENKIFDFYAAVATGASSPARSSM